jgi:LacI family transcriptional regulator
LASEPFEHWFRIHHPDVIVTPFRIVLNFLQKIKVRVGKDVGFISLNRVGDLPDLAGIDQAHEQIAARAVNMLARKIELEERGFSETPETLLITGTWTPGGTAPNRIPAKSRSPDLLSKKQRGPSLQKA